MTKDVTIGRKVMTVSLPGQLYDEFIAICTKHNYNRSAIVSSCIERFVKQERKTSVKSATKP